MTKNDALIELSKYGKTASIRSVPKFFNTKDKFLKALWLMCVLMCTGVLISLLIFSFNRFYTWPVMTKSGELIGKSMKFPDITICNLDSFAAGFPKELPIQSYFNFLKTNRERFKQLVMNISNTSSEYENFVFEEFYSVVGYIFNLPKIDQPDDFDCPDFVVECSVFTSDWIESETQCSKYFTKHWNQDYYTCHTLQTSKLNDVNDIVIRGITLVLNVGPPNEFQMPYRSLLTSSQARGVQVSVHSPGTPPDLKRGFSVAPGTENIVTIVQTERTRLDKPYSILGCTNEKYLSTFPKERYTQDTCIEYCKQTIVYENCGCLSRYLNVPLDVDNNVQICGNFSLYNDSDVEKNSDSKLEFVLRNFLNSLQYITTDDYCDLVCLIPCKETLYDTYLTTATWPQPSLQLSVFDNYIYLQNCTKTHPNVAQRYAKYLQLYNVDDKARDNLDVEKYNVSFSYLGQIQESLLVIKLVIKDNFPFYNTDQPAYTWDTMIGVVGGMLSLWLGVTVATGVELIELVYLLIKCCFKKKKQSESSSRNGYSKSGDEAVEGTIKEIQIFRHFNLC